MLLKEEERRKNFENADLHLNEVFSLYPDPGEMNGCPCCVGDLSIKDDEDLSHYLGHAMTLIGNESDFKHYLPRLFIHAFIDKKGVDDDFFLLMSLNYVKDWKSKEIDAIGSWFAAYTEYYLINEMLEHIDETRVEVQRWIDRESEELICHWPFGRYLDFFNNISPRFYNPIENKGATDLLQIWPQEEKDYIALASCIHYPFFIDKHANLKCNVFQVDRLKAWVRKNVKIMEKIFWKSADPRVQQHISDAIWQLEVFLRP